MTLSHGFRQLANVLERLEASGLEVRDVATTDEDSSQRLTVDLTVTFPLDANESSTPSPPADGEGDALDADDVGADQSEDSTGAVRGRVLNPLSVRTEETNGASAIEPAGEDAPDAEESEAAAGDADAEDPVVDCPVDDCDARFESEHGMKIHRTKVHGEEQDGRADSAPAYRDPDRLREVFDACDSFPEMREALGTDVSAQTVRRQMIAHDIYEPGGSSTGGESDAESTDDYAENSNTDDDGSDRSGGESETSPETSDTSPEAQESTAAGSVDHTDESAGEGRESEGEREGESDDDVELTAIELPEGVTVADLKAGVSSAKTLYDVQRRFDLDRDEAMQLLEKYDLLDVVHGRVSDRDRRKQVDEDEITRRILEHAPVGQPTRA